MKLIDHVLKIRSLITRAISNRFERLGITDHAELTVPTLSENDIELRNRMKAIVDYHSKTAAGYS